MQGHFSSYLLRVNVEASTYRILSDFCGKKKSVRIPWQKLSFDPTSLNHSCNILKCLIYLKLWALSSAMSFPPNYLNRFSQNTDADFVIRFSLQIEKVNSNTLKSFSMNIQLQWTNGRFNHLILYNKHFIGLILLNPHKEGVAAVAIFFIFWLPVSPQREWKWSSLPLNSDNTQPNGVGMQSSWIRAQAFLPCSGLAEIHTPLKSS